MPNCRKKTGNGICREWTSRALLGNHKFRSLVTAPSPTPFLLSDRCPLCRGQCCKTLFGSLKTSGCGDRIIIWRDTLLKEKLTGDLGNEPDGTRPAIIAFLAC